MTAGMSIVVARRRRRAASPEPFKPVQPIRKGARAASTVGQVWRVQGAGSGNIGRLWFFFRLARLGGSFPRSGVGTWFLLPDAPASLSCGPLEQQHLVFVLGRLWAVKAGVVCHGTLERPSGVPTPEHGSDPACKRMRMGQGFSHVGQVWRVRGAVFGRLWFVFRLACLGGSFPRSCVLDLWGLWSNSIWFLFWGGFGP